MERAIETIVVSTELTTEQKVKLSKVLSNIPVVGLPLGGSGVYPDTFEGLVELIKYLGAQFTGSLQREDKANDELLALKQDLKAAGRVLKLITAEDA